VNDSIKVLEIEQETPGLTEEELRPHLKVGVARLGLDWSSVGCSSDSIKIKPRGWR